MAYFGKFKSERLGIDRLPSYPFDSYSVMIVPSDIWDKKYIDGGGIKKIKFSLMSIKPYDANPQTEIDNLMFYDELSKWIEENNRKKILPNIDKAIAVKVISNGYLAFADEKSARYTIELELRYLAD